MPQSIKDRQIKAKILKIRRRLLALWRGTPLSYSNMSPECKVAYLMGCLDQLEKE